MYLVVGPLCALNEIRLWLQLSTSGTVKYLSDRLEHCIFLRNVGPTLHIHWAGRLGGSHSPEVRPNFPADAQANRRGVS